jgi:predicted SAM-dependent methyltransferase
MDWLLDLSIERISIMILKRIKQLLQKPNNDKKNTLIYAHRYSDTHQLNELLRDRIHYGCGKNIFSNWLNVDGFFIDSYPDGSIDQELAKNIFSLDLVGRHPFPDNYFRFGFSEDFIEHLDQADSLNFLSECYRTFAHGGVLRISTPDFRNVLKRHYVESNFEGAQKGQEEAFTMWSHKHFYCFESIEFVSRHIGFRTVKRVEFCKSDHKDLRNLETRRDQIDLNLTVEITK